MTTSEYIAKNPVEKIVVEVKDARNVGYTRKKRIEGAALLADGFKAECACEGDVTASAYITVEGKIHVHIEDEDGGVLDTYDDLADLLASEVLENVKSAIAAELGEEYIEDAA